jgi:Flp pilus assembly pilin Flp
MKRKWTELNARGQGWIEYSLLLALISASTIVALTTVGWDVQHLFLHAKEMFVSATQH